MDATVSSTWQTGVTMHARMLILVFGLLLCGWTVKRLGKRSLLVALGSVFLAIGGALILFASFPALFDRIAYLAGVKYPPLLYLVLALMALLALNVHLAARLSALDVRCRRLTQELALRAQEREPLAGA